MHAITAIKTEVKEEIVQAVFGCFFITLCSLIKIPTLPIPITFQTFAIVVLALLQSPKTAFYSALFYLGAATMGLPVLSGHVNPLWFMGKSGGYLFAFPIAAYVIATFSKKTFFGAKLVALFLGHLIVYSLGFIQLSLFIGIPSAFKWGVLFFIPSTLLKDTLALAAVRFVKRQGI